LLRKRWILHSPWPEEQLSELTRPLDILPLTAAVLLNRGLREPESARFFLEPGSARLLDYRLLPGAAEAGSLLAEAIQRRELIAVAGDYDADGITAAALLCEFIRDCGGSCRVFLPDRQTDGYGLNEKIVQQVLELQAGLLVTVDCGVTAVAEVALARRGGLKVLVTDHHEPGPELPAAQVLVNPKVSGPEAFRSLAGVGVALEIVRGAAEVLGEDKGRLKKYLDLAALGTVADVVPLLGENRILVSSGLQAINAGSRLGLGALIRAAGLEKRALGSGDLAFKLGPRLNAAGRLGDAQNSFELLLTQDPAEADRLAALLNQANARRQALEQTVVSQVLEQVERGGEPPLAIVAHAPEWPLGVLGLAASRVCERYHRPCFVLSEAEGQARGSGRRVPGFALHRALQELAPLLNKWGGHEMAAGVTLSVDKLAEFTQRLNAQVADQLSVDQLVPELALDAEVPLDGITPRLVKELGRLEPYGFGNAKPLLALAGVRLAAPPRVVGDRHLKLKVTDGRRTTLDIIGFGLGARAPEIKQTAVFDLAGHPTENIWNGTTTLQLEIKDFRERA
jgi:single-stranded-DNA-specific exonuclease